MIWAILALLGVPLWFCAIGIGVLVLRNHALRKRYGDVAVRIRRPGKTRWTRGHAVWVSDVLAWRGSPAAWREQLVQVTAAEIRPVTPEEQRHLHRLDGAVIASLRTSDDTVIEVATAAETGAALLGPFAPALAPA